VYKAAEYIGGHDADDEKIEEDSVRAGGAGTQAAADTEGAGVEEKEEGVGAKAQAAAGKGNEGELKKEEEGVGNYPGERPNKTVYVTMSRSLVYKNSVEHPELVDKGRLFSFSRWGERISDVDNDENRKSRSIAVRKMKEAQGKGREAVWICSASWLMDLRRRQGWSNKKENKKIVRPPLQQVITTVCALTTRMEAATVVPGRLTTRYLEGFVRALLPFLLERRVGTCNFYIDVAHVSPAVFFFSLSLIFFFEIFCFCDLLFLVFFVFLRLKK
jgi:hypothetical protein